MRFMFRDAARVRRIARLLQAELSRHGLDWPLNRCRQVTAEACGYPNFHEAEAAAGKGPASVFDEASPPETLQVRRAIQHAALVGHGLAPGTVGEILDRVGFTRGQMTRDPSRAATGTVVSTGMSSRQLRIVDSLRLGPGRIRAGNFDACSLLDASGKFIGLTMGTDMTVETEVIPEQLLEALGIPDGAATLGAARMRMSPALWTGYYDPPAETAGDEGTLLHLHSGCEMVREADYRIPRGGFGEDVHRRPWHSVARDPDAGIITAWGYGHAVFVGYGDVARERVRAIDEAACRDGLAFAFSGRIGPVVLLSDRFDPDLGIEEVIAGIELAVRVRSDRRPGSDLVIDRLDTEWALT